MGQNITTNKILFRQISDFSNVEFPSSYALVKISSFNLKLKNKLTIDKEIDSITNYLFNTFHLKKEIDILCIQGIFDSDLALKLIAHISDKMNEKKKTLYFAPSFNKIEKNSSSITDFIEIIESQNKTKRISTKIENKNKTKAITQNIIISSFPILDWYFCDLDYKHDADDVYGIKSMVCANIILGNKLISVYNYELMNNIIVAGVNNEDIRNVEIAALNYEVSRNKIELTQNEKYNVYKKSDVHLLVGPSNINEFCNNIVNKEFIDSIGILKAIDIYRFINNSDFGYTTKNKKERDSFMFLLSDNSFFQNNITRKNIIEEIHKKYGILFLRSDTYTLPLHLYKQIELIFIIRM